MARHSKPPAPGAWAAAARAGFEATSTQVQQMHQAIADQAFAAVQQVPVVAAPARWVQRVHDTISTAVHATVRQTGATVLTLAGHAEQRFTDPTRPPGTRELALRSVLNGVAGDALQAAGNPLAVRMALLPEGVAPGERVCLFVHGLACDDSSWTVARRASEGDSYPAMVAREFGATPLFLRYNSGLSIADNGRALSALLTTFIASVPGRVGSLVLVGHSMGGLVARVACEQAAADGSPWLERIRMLVCLGTPHRGAPLERAGQVLSSVLDASAMTRPLSRLADARSRGIRDLRDGAPPNTVAVPMRLVAGLGDGLVRPGSAGDPALAGDVERVEIDGIGHMALLNHPRVAAALRRWLRSTWP
ncbi:alpha/beta hydrolase [Rhizobacter sp. SG703]|uniref:PGAP1-like alpha/beta domain-containing protein n=1 Tax=Rhizobacter sp. SG703 TaxID=2587140 RepID=UPI001444C88B|nr:alpha/beta hydrolase [Rhizobacter sp. SG703]NKI96032.1 pimeloyl-ACP methyl ester carboxylesterase [Rhizobacter sp. SG703]